jgi:hypothetical protein
MTDPEIAITAELVHDLLEDQHPDLAGLTIREIVGGWDNRRASAVLVTVRRVGK